MPRRPANRRRKPPPRLPQDIATEAEMKGMTPLEIHACGDAQSEDIATAP